MRTLRINLYTQFRRNLRDTLLYSSIRIRKQLALVNVKGVMDIVWQPVKEYRLKRIFKN
jgi:hypothetical protein